jgi:hypothetical protein
MIGTKKPGVGFNDKMGPFSLHDASRFRFTVLVETKHACFLTPLVVGWQQRWHVLHVIHASLDTHEQHDLVLDNINKDYLYVDVASFVP